MEGTLIVCASHHGVALETQQCMAALQKQGARLLSATGVADVALARNQVLTHALHFVAQPQVKPPDVFLLVDDDMVWKPEAAAELVQRARSTGECWSAAYATKDGGLAATPLDWDASRTDGLRMVGLGFCAVPVAKLEALGKRLGLVVGPNGKALYPFCQCATVKPEHDGITRWCSEDYWLCLSLGGVRLAPYIAAGHLKTVPLWPDDETLRRLADGTPLGSDDNTPPAVGGSEPPTNPGTPKTKTRGKRSKRRKVANGSAQTRA